MNGSTSTAALPRKASFGETMRADVWWAQPLLVFLGLGTFIVYSTWAAFQGESYYFGNYVSPFYSPEIFGSSPHSWFGPKPNWWPSWLLFSPALLILWAPGGFRLTCYYYRGAYYKAFWADPPACTVGEPRKTYLGERSFPLIMQNVHRYFLYLALAFIVTLTLPPRIAAAGDVHRMSAAVFTLQYATAFAVPLERSPRRSRANRSNPTR